MNRITFRQAVGHLLSWQRTEGGLAIVREGRRGPLVGAGELRAVSDCRLEFQILTASLQRPVVSAQSVVIDCTKVRAIWHLDAVDGHSVEEAITIEDVDGGRVLVCRLALDRPG